MSCLKSDSISANAELTEEQVNNLTDRVDYRRAPPTDFNRMLGIGQETYCRYVWSERIARDNSPWRAIGNRQSGKRTTTLSQFYLDASIGRDCSVDCFISPNQFYDWRKTEQLVSLHASWLEIDINNPAGITRKNKRSLTHEEEEEVVQEVFQQLSQASIPMPTGYVLSGTGGVHLYWVYEEVEAFKWRVNAWRTIASQLVRKMKGGKLWHVDLGATKDPARVLRIPGTKHGSTKRKVEFFGGGPTYTFGELAETLGIKIFKPKALAALPAIKKASSKKKRVFARRSSNPISKSGKHTIGQWWFKIYTHVLHHIIANPVKEGMRDSTAFILYVALSHIQTEEEAYRRVSQINEQHIGLTEEQLKKYLKTARQTHYKYKKESIADYLSRQLGMDISFLYQSKHKLTQKEVAEARREAAITTAKKKADSTLELIVRAVRELITQSAPLTQTSVAAICGRSERTVRRYWKEVMRHPAISSPSIYSPPTFMSASSCMYLEQA